MNYHVIKPGTSASVAYCGRRVGTPGGVIYPGVRGKHPEWFRDHPFPDVIRPVICKTCSKSLPKTA